MSEDWQARWTEGRIGWHEADGNTALKEYWPARTNGWRVLVPLCGKSPDLTWLVHRGCDVSGIELSEIACNAFFEEQQLDYEVTSVGTLQCYAAVELPLKIYCGDYFDYRARPFDAIFDRGSLVAFPADERPAYVSHTRTLLKIEAYQLLLALEYDQAAADGPPWAVHADEVQKCWPRMRRIASRNDIDNGPPKFRKAGLTEFLEVVWAP